MWFSIIPATREMNNETVIEAFTEKLIRMNQVRVYDVLFLTLILSIGAPKSMNILYRLLLAKLYRKSRHHMLLLNLAVADSIVIFIMIPTEIAWRITYVWLAGSVACKTYVFVRVFGLYASNMMLICISVDRFYAVSKPFSYASMSSRIGWLIKVSWIISFAAALPEVKRYYTLIFLLITHLPESLISS